jgi:hypothetical protein
VRERLLIVLGGLLIAALPVLAQAPSLPGPPDQPVAQGLPPEWEVRQQLADLTSQTERLTPLVRQIEPANWRDGSDAYVAQQKALLNQIQYVTQVIGALSRQPERTTLALDAFFRLQSIESLVLSFSDGIRRYQNPAVADLLTSLTNETAASRERLREYLKELVAMREQERDVLEKEAQRCRSTPPRVTPAAKPKAKD